MKLGLVSLLVSLSLSVASLALAGPMANPGVTPAAATLTTSCGQNTNWSSATQAGACEISGNIGQRLLTVNQYADAANDTLAISVCGNGACTSSTLTASTAAIPISFTVAAYGSCAGDTMTVSFVDGQGYTISYPLVEAVTWTAATSNDVTAASLKAAIAALPGTSASVNAAVVSVFKPANYRSVTLASSDTNCATVINDTDLKWHCTGSNAMCASSLSQRVHKLLDAGSLSGFGVSCSNDSCSDGKLGFVSTGSTTDIGLTVTNSAGNAFGAVTAGPNGALQLGPTSGVVAPVIPGAAAMVYDVIRFCGNGPNATTATYVGPVTEANFGADMSYSSTTCDGKDNVTEATADAPLDPVTTLKPVAMWCVSDCGTDDVMTLQLRDDTADVQGVTCNITLAGAARSCTVRLATPPTIAANSAIAVRVVNSTNDNCSAGDLECRVYVTH